MIRSKTYIAVPPGATIKEQLEYRNMSQKEFAKRMGISEKHISKLINGEVLLTTEMANSLEMVLGISSSFWINLEGHYRNKLLKAKEENEISSEMEIASHYPYNAMRVLKWLPEAKNKIEKVYNLRKFFEVARLDLINENTLPQVAFRRQLETEKANYAIDAWIQKAKLDARNIDTKDIDIKKLEVKIKEIRKMTKLNPNEFSNKLVNDLSECGIALVFVPHIEGSYLQAASFVDGKKIVIGITTRGRDADKFWFSLFHEFGHIIHKHIYITKKITSVEEEIADEYARNALIPQDEYNRFKNSCFTFDKASIKDFANSIDIDPGIVVGRLQNDKLVPYSIFNDMKKKYDIEVI